MISGASLVDFFLDREQFIHKSVFGWAKVKTDEALKAICGGCFNIVWIFLKIFYEVIFVFLAKK